MRVGVHTVVPGGDAEPSPSRQGSGGRSGADSGTAGCRKDFANGPTHPRLPAVPVVATYRTKGDQDPDERQPPPEAYGSTDDTAWTNVKNTYRLPFTAAETQLTEMLETYPS